VGKSSPCFVSSPEEEAIRDSIHVDGLADVHVRLLELLQPGQSLIDNGATGRGYSVPEVVEAARRVMGHPIPAVERPRRPGAPPELVASPEAIMRDLGWRPRYIDIEAITVSTWWWHSRHPNGDRHRGASA
jgi:UDP-glucose 4-epimerase